MRLALAALLVLPGCQQIRELRVAGREPADLDRHYAAYRLRPSSL